MVVPIDLLKPVLDDMLTFGTRKGPARPWLGMYVADTEDKLVVMGLANRGPAQRARIDTGDIVTAVNGVPAESLADLFRKIWVMGDAGVDVPLTLLRDGRSVEIVVKSADRSGARFAVIVGEDERAQRTVAVKDLKAGTQTVVPRDELVERIRTMCSQVQSRPDAGP